MKTGIDLFDEQEFRPGEVIVVAGSTGSGKTSVATDIAFGLAQNKDIDVLHVDLENTREAWRRRQKSYGQKPANLTHRGIVDGAFSPEDFGNAAVVLDCQSSYRC